MSTSLLWHPLVIVDSEGNFADLRMSLSNCWTWLEQGGIGAPSQVGGRVMPKPAKAAPAKAKPVKAKPVKAKPAKAAPAKAKPAKAAPAKAKPVKAKPAGKPSAKKPPAATGAAKSKKK
jgi:hypothetical protein